jgi:PilZ domain
MIDPSPTRGIHCQGCDQRLPLRMSGPAEVATLWECAACGTAFAGVLLPEQATSLAKSVRLAQLHFDAEHAEPLPDSFRTTVLERISKQTDREFVERRRSPREAIQLDAVAIGLDANYMLVGPTCHGLVVNLSSHGMLLTTPVILPSTSVAVQMQGGSEKVQLLGKIVWSRHLGGSCYGAGVDFVARLGKVPANSATSPLFSAGADHSSD